jgi:ankyrin repeat protein
MSRRLAHGIAAAALVAAAVSAGPHHLAAQETLPMDGSLTMMAEIDHADLLLKAVGDGDAENVRTLMAAFERERRPWPTDRYAGSLLHIAARGDSEAVLQMLLAAGFSANQRGPGGRTPLHDAAMSERPRLALLLLASGAEVDSRTQYGFTPLHLSVGVMTQLLLDAGANPLIMDAHGQTAMFYAGTDKDALMKAGLDINTRNPAGWTPLHVAAFKSNVAFAEALLNRGADLEARTLTEFVIKGDEAWGSQERTIPAGYTALDIATHEHDRVKWVTGRNRPMIEMLRARGAKRPFLGLRFLSW